MHRNQYYFTPKLFPTLLTIALLPLLIGLGCWQLHRAEVKRHLLNDYKQRSHLKPLAIVPTEINPALQFYPVLLKGRYDNQHQFLLDNRLHQHRAGYEVLTPLQLHNTQYTILVNRGWIRRGQNRHDLPLIKPIEGEQYVYGILKIPNQKTFVLSEIQENPGQWPRIVQKIDLSQLQNALSQPLLPYLILLSPNAPHGFIRKWKLATLSPPQHIGYAVQWFTLAITLLVIYIAVNLRKKPRTLNGTQL